MICKTVQANTTQINNTVQQGVTDMQDIYSTRKAQIICDQLYKHTKKHNTFRINSYKLLDFWLLSIEIAIFVLYQKKSNQIN